MTDQAETFQSSDLGTTSAQTEHWRSLAYSMPPGTAPGNTASVSAKDTSHDAQWLRKISLVVYSAGKSSATGNMAASTANGTDYSGGTDNSSGMVDQPYPDSGVPAIDPGHPPPTRFFGPKRWRAGARDDTTDTGGEGSGSSGTDSTGQDASTTDASNASGGTNKGGPDTSDGLELSELRVDFNVKRITKTTPDILWARVYNMDPKTMAKVINFTRVQLKAGYKFAGYGLIFDGQVVQYRRGKENATDTYLEIHAGDADKEINTGVFSGQYAVGTEDLQIIKDCVRQMGLEIGEIGDGIGTQKTQRDSTYAEAGKDRLQAILAKYDASFFVENGKAIILKNGATRKGAVVVLTPKTGLVGLPELTPQGVQVKCLLNPNIRPGSIIELSSDVISGVPFTPGSAVKTNSGGSTQGTQGTQGGADFPTPTGGLVKPTATWGQQLETAFTSPVGRYKVILLEFSGDTRGNPWYCDMVCVALDANDAPIFGANPSTVWTRAAGQAIQGTPTPAPTDTPPAEGARITTAGPLMRINGQLVRRNK